MFCYQHKESAFQNKSILKIVYTILKKLKIPSCNKCYWSIYLFFFGWYDQLKYDERYGDLHSSMVHTIRYIKNYI